MRRVSTQRVSRVVRIILLAGVCALALQEQAHAYVGPGAGFAVGTTLVAFFIAMFSGLAAIFLWPMRWFARFIRGRRALKRARKMGI